MVATAAATTMIITTKEETIPTGATADANIDFEIDDRRIRERRNRRTDA